MSRMTPVEAGALTIIAVVAGFVCEYLHESAFYKRAQGQSVLKHAGFIIEAEDKHDQG